MKKTILLIFLLSLSNISLAKEYGTYDVMKIVSKIKTENGSAITLDVPYLDKIINDLALHARNYPPQFDNVADKNSAISDTTRLSAMLDVIVNVPKPQLFVLKRTSMLNQIGHNLDIPKAAERADRDYQNLINQLPDDPIVNLSYGEFLAGSNQVKKALPYLKKSVELGHSQAFYALGVAYLTLQDKEKALSNLEQYQKHNPKDTQVKLLIETIKNGEIRYNQQ